jgi:hypothetical protein
MKKVLLGLAILLGLFTLVFFVAFGIFLWNYDDQHRKVTDATNAQEQRQLKADPKLIVARRKQYVEQYRQLWRVDDYATVRKKAQDGNPIAQRRLYEIYEHCIDMRTSETLPMLSRIASVNKKMAATVKQLQADYDRFCGPAAAGPESTGKIRAFWMRQSASRGDLVSQMRVAAAEAKAPIPPEQVKDFLRRTIISGDPAAIEEIGYLLPYIQKPWPDQNVALAFEDSLAVHGWILAACRAGMDCGPGSRVMTKVCLRGMNCMWPDYQTYVATDGVSVEKLRQLENVVAVIEGGALDYRKLP